MKYYNLPTTKQILAYQRGELNKADAIWIEKMMRKNPFVKEVVEDFNPKNSSDIAEISERVRARIQQKFVKNRGINWTKLGLWTGLSSIALIIGLVLFNKNNSNKKYIYASLNLEKDEIILEADEALKETVISDTKETEDIKKISVDDEINDEIHSSSEVDAETVSKAKNQEDMEVATTEDEEDAIKDNKERINLSGKLLKNIRSIEFSNINKYGNKNREIPSYPGGNTALKAHFKGYISPIELQYGEEMYDPNALLIFTINNKGFLEEHKTIGNLHEKHNEEIKKAFDELPRFKPGKGKVTYDMKINFN